MLCLVTVCGVVKYTLIASVNPNSVPCRSLNAFGITQKPSLVLGVPDVQGGVPVVQGGYPLSGGDGGYIVFCSVLTSFRCSWVFLLQTVAMICPPPDARGQVSPSPS